MCYFSHESLFVELGDGKHGIKINTIELIELEEVNTLSVKQKIEEQQVKLRENVKKKSTNKQTRGQWMILYR